MDNNEKKEKGNFSNFLQKASDISKKTADSIQKGVKDLSERAKDEMYSQRLKKYNPLFAKEYKAKDFIIPDIVSIVDDEEIQKIDVCAGAIGWRDREKEVEVLYLSDEWVKSSGIQFIPSAKCNETYCVDPFDRKRYIQSDSIFSKAHEERMAELERIAYLLGAKRCSIEIMEADTQIKSAGMSAKVVGAKLDASARNASVNSRSGRTETSFEGNSEPQRPELKWFVDDDNIKSLIEMRFSTNNSVKSRVLVLEGSSSATMSKKIAGTLDKIAPVKASASLESQAVKEHSRKLIFEVEF